MTVDSLIYLNRGSHLKPDKDIHYNREQETGVLTEALGREQSYKDHFSIRGHT